MKAIVCSEITEDLSGVDLADIAEPEPGPGEVKIQVKASSINFPDILMCQGKYQFKPELPFSPGMEMAGVIVAVGAGVEHLKPGMRITGGNKTGGFAEYAILPAGSVRELPDNFGYAEAASFGAAYLTAYVSLVRRARIESGETLLIHGASGGVGMATIDVGKMLGATVIATSGSDAKLDALTAYGADYVINTRDGFRERVKELTGGKGADVIFDPVGGDVFDESTRCIAFDGRLLVIGFTSGRIAEVKTNIPLIKGFSVVGVRAGEYGRRFPEKGRENMDAIWQMAAEGKTRPYIHDQLPLERVLDGFRMLQNREVIGKLVITP